MAIKLEDITIREFSEQDLNKVQEYCDYINGLIEEDAKILMNKTQTVADEKKFVESSLSAIKEKKRVMIIAEHNGKIVGLTDVKVEPYRRSHIGLFGISIHKDYRGMGLGKTIMGKVIELAKKELPGLKIIRLEVYENNKPAQALYKKMGFKKVAKLPKQIQYKGKLIAEHAMLLELK